MIFRDTLTKSSREQKPIPIKTDLWGDEEPPEANMPHIPDSLTGAVVIPIIVTPAGKPVPRLNHPSQPSVLEELLTKASDIANIEAVGELDHSPRPSTPNDGSVTPNCPSMLYGGSLEHLPEALLGLTQNDRDGTATLAGTDEADEEVFSLGPVIIVSPSSSISI